MKKLLAITLALAMLLSLMAGCSGGKSEGEAAAVRLYLVHDNFEQC